MFGGNGPGLFLCDRELGELDVSRERREQRSNGFLLYGNSRSKGRLYSHTSER